jgi:hypothetical protein
MKFSYPPKFEHDNEPALWQNPFEFYKTVELIEKMGVKTVLEIGTGWGLFAEYLWFKGISVWSIDINPMTPLDGPASSLLFVGDSKSEEAFHWAFNKMPPGRYGAVYIDGAHDYETCLIDFTKYKQLASKMVMIHDIDGNQVGKYPVDIGPNELWMHDIHRNYNTMEIRAKQNENCGVGIVFISEEK